MEAISTIIDFAGYNRDIYTHFLLKLVFTIFKDSGIELIPGNFDQCTKSSENI